MFLCVGCFSDCKHICVIMVCQKVLSLYINIDWWRNSIRLKTSFLLRCAELLGIYSLKVINMLLSRKEKTLGFTYFIFVKIFDIFRLLMSLQGSEHTMHCTYFKNDILCVIVLWALPPGVMAHFLSLDWPWWSYWEDDDDC